MRFPRVITGCLFIACCLFLSSCYGQMLGTSDVAGRTARLNAEGHSSCQTDAALKGGVRHFEYARSSQALAQGLGRRTADKPFGQTQGACDPVPPNISFASPISELLPGTDYWAQLCGHDTGDVSDMCSEATQFTTASSPKMVDDPALARGVDVIKNCSGRDNLWPVEYSFQPGTSSQLGPPQWALYQRFSFYNIKDPATAMTSGPFTGMWKWSDYGKELYIRKDATAAWDLVTTINTMNEYRWNTYHIYPSYKVNPATGYYECTDVFPGYVKDLVTGLYRFADYHKWVSLSTGYLPGPEGYSKPLNQLTNLNFKMTAKLISGKIIRTSQYGINSSGKVVDPGKVFNPKRHIIHYMAFVHLQNLNRDDEVGYKAHRLNLILPIYHSEDRMGPGHGPMLDPPTQTWMVAVPQSTITTASLWSMAPVKFSANLLPQAIQGIRAAYPGENVANWVVTGFHMGFEANGVGAVKIAVKDLSFTAQ